ncbi:uncharacterized protein LOC113466449 [Diaphorina citri]|uniref:Uncharacterized protein LOC113466449 n=1 Tax=Diaphorina citri TaxID=121845 RepID=A0A3Q0ITK5_DIACI|nr:uncharacterized protein LOC113466449 [Diaphorina citri]
MMMLKKLPCNFNDSKVMNNKLMIKNMSTKRLYFTLPELNLADDSIKMRIQKTTKQLKQIVELIHINLRPHFQPMLNVSDMMSPINIDYTVLTANLHKPNIQLKYERETYMVYQLNFDNLVNISCLHERIQNVDAYKVDQHFLISIIDETTISQVAETIKHSLKCVIKHFMSTNNENLSRNVDHVTLAYNTTSGQQSEEENVFNVFNNEDQMKPTNDIKLFKKEIKQGFQYMGNMSSSTTREPPDLKECLSSLLTHTTDDQIMEVCSQQHHQIKFNSKSNDNDQSNNEVLYNNSYENIPSNLEDSKKGKQKKSGTFKLNPSIFDIRCVVNSEMGKNGRIFNITPETNTFSFQPIVHSTISSSTEKTNLNESTETHTSNRSTSQTNDSPIRITHLVNVKHKFKKDSYAKNREKKEELYIVDQHDIKIGQNKRILEDKRYGEGYLDHVNKDLQEKMEIKQHKSKGKLSNPPGRVFTFFDNDQDENETTQISSELDISHKKYLKAHGIISKYEIHEFEVILPTTEMNPKRRINNPRKKNTKPRSNKPNLGKNIDVSEKKLNENLACREARERQEFEAPTGSLKSVKLETKELTSPCCDSIMNLYQSLSSATNVQLQTNELLSPSCDSIMYLYRSLSSDTSIEAAGDCTTESSSNNFVQRETNQHEKPSNNKNKYNRSRLVMSSEARKKNISNKSDKLGVNIDKKPQHLSKKGRKKAKTHANSILDFSKSFSTDQSAAQNPSRTFISMNNKNIKSKSIYGRQKPRSKSRTNLDPVYSKDSILDLYLNF